MMALHKNDKFIGKKTVGTEFGPVDYDFLFKTEEGAYYMITYDSRGELEVLELEEADGKREEEKIIAGRKTVSK